MTNQTPENHQTDTVILQVDLTDLLQLEFDALCAYSVAIAGLRRPDLRESLCTFRADHEQHVRELSARSTLWAGSRSRSRICRPAS